MHNNLCFSCLNSSASLLDGSKTYRGLSLNQTSFTDLWDWSLLLVFRMWLPTSNISNPWELIINASSQAPPQTF